MWTSGRAAGLTICQVGLLFVAVTAPTARPQNSLAASAKSYVDSGNAEYAKGELDRAFADYTLALAFNPLSAIAYYDRGCIRQDKHDVDGALEDYNRAIAIRPQYADAYTNRGTTHNANETSIVGRNYPLVSTKRFDRRLWFVTS